MGRDFVTVIGGGLAGCEVAWQLACRGIAVRLCEMRPLSTTPAHHTDRLGELVCSNSFRSASLDSAVGLLKQEMRFLGSIILEVAARTAVPAGSALAVDRERFSMISPWLQSGQVTPVGTGRTRGRTFLQSG